MRIFALNFKRTVMAKAINLSLIEQYYRIEEDGMIWSYLKDRYKGVFLNRCNYVYVTLKGVYGPIGVHRLVAAKYIGVCPDGMEINHKDGDKLNNHWMNLEYVTHSENIKKSYEMGRVGPMLGKKLGPCSDATKAKMAAAKNKAVVSDDGEVWDSIWACAWALGINRKAIYNAIKFKRSLKKNGLRLQFVTP